MADPRVWATEVHETPLSPQNSVENQLQLSDNSDDEQMRAIESIPTASFQKPRQTGLGTGQVVPTDPRLEQGNTPRKRSATNDVPSSTTNKTKKTKNMAGAEGSSQAVSMVSRSATSVGSSNNQTKPRSATVTGDTRLVNAQRPTAQGATCPPKQIPPSQTNATTRPAASSTANTENANRATRVQNVRTAQNSDPQNGGTGFLSPFIAYKQQHEEDAPSSPFVFTLGIEGLLVNSSTMRISKVHAKVETTYVLSAVPEGTFQLPLFKIGHKGSNGHTFSVIPEARQLAIGTPATGPKVTLTTTLDRALTQHTNACTMVAEAEFRLLENELRCSNHTLRLHFTTSPTASQGWQLQQRVVLTVGSGLCLSIH